MTILTNFLKKWGATMAEYIEREAAIKALKDNVIEMERHIYFGSNLGVPEDEIEDIVNEIPVADVEPVKHGRWGEVGGTPKGQMFHCSICHKVAYFPQPTRDKTWKKQCPYTYCPNCGAKMDGKEVQE